MENRNQSATDISAKVKADREAVKVTSWWDRAFILIEAALAIFFVVAAVFAVAAVGVVAVPTGILAASFSNAFQRERRKGNKQPGE